MFIYSPYISFCDMKETIFIIDERDSGVYSLNAVSAEVWRLVEMNYPLEMIVNKISSIYGISSDEISVDISQILFELQEMGLIINDCA
ncbi:PqqD family protein [Gorillibacterium sp. CAU 1737]|uniref:PqqD family protein n=1 Tax=Gorillibacterium sp. CAU 1737 TaxID=3140362 RepID=UPI003261347E